MLHQVVTHKILVSVRQDWARGQVAGAPPAQVGVIELDIVNNRVLPLLVNLAAGSVWTGFWAMIALGIQHIAQGTDHLLFLLVLLLPAPLLAARGRWGAFGGVRYSLKRLLLIVTAFTLGHSLTLLTGAAGWLRLPSQSVELLIAFSILISALHAVRPLFPGCEAGVAAGFGLVHGLAFAGTLANLHLDAGRMALSIFGFNLGIDLMQLFVVALTVLWRRLLSRASVYGPIRVLGGIFAGVAALAWMSERLWGQSNLLTDLVEQAATFAPWLLAALTIAALGSYFWERSKRPAPASR
ncbi:hypothetical protein SAMN00120144_3210 [Hymenobacter roseosalivarius DSM 11622]|uniref:HupE / UreJ protein n=1 Tax=Hymenobacter roseosalivarius DSM 11622 TaxID=645990 RepID=A0A1W1W2W4_9BACT|nr:HupE/UreJ family protein [Hymenobacter roseosalivarius]SMB99957.1 hypothetical protein SAMN00120144_3210 [Hymenobacter roseosalivarius DSM 11622]